MISNTSSDTRIKSRVTKMAPFFKLNDMHPQHGDKSITIEDDTPENRVLIASHLEEYSKQGFRLYVTLTKKKPVQNGILFKKTVMVEEKVSYLVRGYDQEKNEWILETDTPVEGRNYRRAIRRSEVTVIRPVFGG